MSAYSTGVVRDVWRAPSISVASVRFDRIPAPLTPPALARTLRSRPYAARNHVQSLAKALIVTRRRSLGQRYYLFMG